jgi:hypothetical protein
MTSRGTGTFFLDIFSTKRYVELSTKKAIHFSMSKWGVGRSFLESEKCSVRQIPEDCAESPAGLARC